MLIQNNIDDWDIPPGGEGCVVKKSFIAYQERRINLILVLYKQILVIFASETKASQDYDNRQLSFCFLNYLTNNQKERKLSLLTSCRGWMLRAQTSFPP